MTAFDPDEAPEKMPRGGMRPTRQPNWRARMLSALAICVAAIILSWPSLINGGPFFIADTSAYIRGADAAISSQLGYRSAWSDKRDLYLRNDAAGADAEQAKPPRHGGAAHPPLLGRSVYYGAFLYVPVLLTTEQMGVFAQCALAALTIWLALLPWRRGPPGRWAAAYVLVCAILALLTALPFTASLLVPDFLTGIACVSLISMLCFWDRYSRVEVGLLSALLCFAAIAHSSNLPLILALSISGLLMRLAGCRLSFRAAMFGVSAVLLGLAADAVFIAAVKSQTGMAPIRPPFLTARLIADGPGYEFLRAHCGERRFEVCRYVARTPGDSDQFLWSNGQDGVFSTGGFETQRRLAEQDVAFAWSTVTTYPTEVLFSTIKATGRQLGLLNYDIWHGKEGGEPYYSLDNLPPAVAARMGRTLSVHGRMPVEPFQTLDKVFAGLSLVVAITCLALLSRSRNAHLRAISAAILLALVAILANAAISGGLSKPDARYHLKIVWILPLFVLIFVVAAGRFGRRDVEAGDPA
jgi:hypothetical protein